MNEDNKRKQPIMKIMNFYNENISVFFSNNDKYIKWGRDNKEPQFYLNLYNTVVEHSSSINFILNNLILDGIDEIDFWNLQKITLDYLIFGGFAVEVTKTNGGDKKYKYIDIQHIRYNNQKTRLGYCEEFNKQNALINWYQISDGTKPGIFIFKNPKSRELYPSPYWYAVSKNLDTMKEIVDYHNNNAKCGFTPSVIINFNNGEPDEETKEDMYKDIEENLTGSKGKKFIMMFNDSKTSSTTIEKLETDNLDEKFESLQKFIQNQIIVAHQITSGQLIGIKPENQGFSRVEYDEAFAIFKENMIKILRKEIEYGLSLLIGKEIEIKDNNESNVVGDNNNDLKNNNVAQ